MIAIPRSLRILSVGQFSLAFIFSLWLLVLPNGGPTFAWPVAPRLSAVFIGTSFLLRVFIGLSILRAKDWYRLRWVIKGNYAFLTVILIATFWHAAEMNWKTNILLAHIWIIVYVFEPLVLPFLGPFGAEGAAPVPPENSEGPILDGLRRVLIANVMVGTTIAGLLFINPQFTNTRWPWLLDPFNARIMAAWPAAVAMWCATLALAKDWAEIKMGVLAMILYGGALFAGWLVTLSQYDMTRPNIYTYGFIVGALPILLAFYYWRQEQKRAAGLSGIRVASQQGH
jgi:hypothetical protein